MCYLRRNVTPNTRGTGSWKQALQKQAPLILLVATPIVLALIYYGYQGASRTRCDGIFEQTADRLQANLELIKNKGGLVLGREKVQELTDSSQKVALHLKTCCVAQQSGAMNAEQLGSCINGAKDYETKIVQVSTAISEASAAQTQGNAPLVQQKTEQARQVATEAAIAAKTLGGTAETLRATVIPNAPPQPVRGGSEQEPNDTILQANAAETGTNITGEIAPNNDADFYKFQYRDAKNRRDIIAVHVENQSPAFRPNIRLHAEDKSILRDWLGPNADGANVDVTFSAEAGKTYYVAVASYNGYTAGKYVLSMVPQKAYDEYEPNDDGFTATPIAFGQTLDANIMDGSDVDWYRISGIKGTSVTVRVENASKTLQPAIRVHNADKSVLADWSAANIGGADHTITFAAEPGREYFLVVGAYNGYTSGKYRLSTR